MPLKVPPMLISLRVAKGARTRRSREARIQIEILELRETRWDYVRAVPIAPNSPLESVALEVVASLSMTFENI